MAAALDTRTSTLIERALKAEDMAKQNEAAYRARMAPPGGLGLSPLLDQRRLEYAIPDGAFRVQAAFERVLVWDIAPAEMASMQSSTIIAPVSAQERIKGRSPRGIIVSAGAVALDALRSNGIDLGHIVLTTHYVIGCTPVEYINGIEVTINIMQAGDITGSEDTAQMLREGSLRLEWLPDLKMHAYRWADGSHACTPPLVPWTPKSI